MPPAKCGHRSVLYGPGGIGKTSLACMAGRVVFVDGEKSLGILAGQLTRRGITIPQLVNVESWGDLRGALASDVFDGCETMVIDSGTKAEQWAISDTFLNVRADRNTVAKRLEDYSFGKGPQHVYDTFLPLLGDLDRHARAGRNVILIAHDCVANVPNPAGGDWIRYEPRLQSPKSGSASIRLAVREWADHVLFLQYDVAIDKDTNKAKGSGTRTLCTAELPHFMAKSRTTQEQIPIYDESPWPVIFGSAK